MKYGFGLLILIGSLMLQPQAVFGQGPADGETPSAPLSSMAGQANDLLMQITEAAANAGLELRACTLKPASLGGETGVEIAGETGGFDSLRAFLAEVGKTRAVGFTRLAARSQAGADGGIRVKLDAELAVAAGASGKPGNDLESILQPLGDLSFFLPGSGRPEKPHLIGVIFESGQGTVFRLVASRLEDFAQLRSRPGMPASSETVSRSSEIGGDLYNLDFHAKASAVPTDELLATFDFLAKRLGTRELSMSKTPEGMKIRVSTEFAPDRYERLQEVLVEKKWSLVHCDARPQIGEDAEPRPLSWSGVLTMKPGEATGGIQAAFDEWRKVFGLAWPSGDRDSLVYSWGPQRSTLSVRVRSDRIRRGPNGVELDPASTNPAAPSAPATMIAERPVGKPLPLRDAFAELGMKFLESKPVETRELTDASEIPGSQVIMTWYRQIGAGVSANQTGFSTDLEKSLFPVGTVLERNVVAGEGRWFRLQVPRQHLPTLVEALLRQEAVSLNRFVLTCNPPADPEVTLVLGDRAEPRDVGRTEAVRRLLGSEFPWNLPIDALPESMALSRLEVFSHGMMVITGWTAKSGRIFSELFPALQKIPGLVEPFFSEGNYKDSPKGRIMRFTASIRYRPSESGR